MFRRLKEIFGSNKKDAKEDKENNNRENEMRKEEETLEELEIGWIPSDEPDYSGYYPPAYEDTPHVIYTIIHEPHVFTGFLEPQSLDEYPGDTPHARPQAGASEVRPWKPIERHVFTDGSFTKNMSGYGIYMEDDHPLNRSVRLSEPHCIDRAEIQAILQSLLLLLKTPETDREILVMTDSLSTVMALHHIKGEREKWPLPKVPQVLKSILPGIIDSYREEMNVLITLAERFPGGVKIEHVRSHIGIPGNERADLYAKISTMGIQGALRSRSKDEERKSDRIWSGRPFTPYFKVNPSAAKRNLSLLMLDLNDRNNGILYPMQQIVWDQNHATTEEELVEMMEDYRMNSMRQFNARMRAKKCTRYFEKND